MKIGTAPDFIGTHRGPTLSIQKVRFAKCSNGWFWRVWTEMRAGMKAGIWGQPVRGRVRQLCGGWQRTVDAADSATQRLTHG